MRHARTRRRNKPATAKRVLTGTGVGVSVTTLGLLTPAVGHAATTAQWQRVAACESSGNWAIDSGNGYYGGLQISLPTWDQFGGTAYAARPDQATPAEQMAVANGILAAQGWGAWPVCSHYAGPAAGPAIPAPPAAHWAPPPAAPAGPPPGAGSVSVATAARPPAPPPRSFVVNHPGPGSASPPAARPGAWERVSPAQVEQGSGPDFVLPASKR